MLDRMKKMKFGKKEQNESKKKTEALIAERERKFFEGVFNWPQGKEASQAIEVHDFGSCGSAFGDHKARRTIETLKYQRNYYMLVKQFLHNKSRSKSNPESNLALSIYKLSGSKKKSSIQKDDAADGSCHTAKELGTFFVGPIGESGKTKKDKYYR